MTKFKVGDIVKVVGNKAGHGWPIGKEVELVELDSNGFWETKGFGDIWWVHEYDIELVKSVKETYEVGKWYGWNGGECPVEDETIVDLIWGAYGSVSYETNERADSWSWKVDEDTAPIVAFRVVSKANPPVFVGWVDGVFVQDSLFFEVATHKLYEDMTMEEL